MASVASGQPAMPARHICRSSPIANASTITRLIENDERRVEAERLDDVLLEQRRHECEKDLADPLSHESSSSESSLRSIAPSLRSMRSMPRVTLLFVFSISCRHTPRR